VRYANSSPASGVARKMRYSTCGVLGGVRGGKRG
jgi:hypothetical protein